MQIMQLYMYMDCNFSNINICFKVIIYVLKFQLSMCNINRNFSCQCDDYESYIKLSIYRLMKIFFTILYHRNIWYTIKQEKIFSAI